MTDAEKERLIDFLAKKMCGPCRAKGADGNHEGCVEAEALIAIVSRG